MGFWGMSKCPGVSVLRRRLPSCCCRRPPRATLRGTGPACPCAGWGGGRTRKYLRDDGGAVLAGGRYKPPEDEIEPMFPMRDRSPFVAMQIRFPGREKSQTAHDRGPGEGTHRSRRSRRRSVTSRRQAAVRSAASRRSAAARVAAASGSPAPPEGFARFFLPFAPAVGGPGCRTPSPRRTPGRMLVGTRRE